MLTVAVTASAAARDASPWEADFTQGLDAIFSGDYHRAEGLIQGAREQVEHLEVNRIVRARVDYALGYVYRLKG